MHPHVPHITLIGMAGVGKSSIARRVQKRLQDMVTICELDDRIVEDQGAATLQDVLASMSPKKFIELEGRIAMQATSRLNGPTIISPGGSIIYNDRAMAILHHKTHVIYLETRFEWVEERIAKKPRALVLKPGQSLRQLYEERIEIYPRWAHETLFCDSKRTREKIAGMLAKRLLALAQVA